MNRCSLEFVCFLFIIVFIDNYLTIIWLICFDCLGQQLLPDNKEYFIGNTRLTPTEGSTRSDEGYHSNGFHDDHLTPPEDSSDSDIDNYVLDLRAVKPKKNDKEKEKIKTTEVLMIKFVK